MENLLTVVFSRERSATPEGQAMEKAILNGLDRWPELPVLVLPHLYDLLPRGMSSEALREIRTNIVVLSWLYPRAAFWVLQANGVQGQMGRTPLVPKEELEPAPVQSGRSAPADSARTKDSSVDSLPGQGAEAGRTIWCLDLRSPGQPQLYLAEIERLVQLTKATAVPLAEAVGPPSKLGPYTMQEINELLRPRWYPVIDYGRCTNCQECLNFCLFGVYDLDARGRVWVKVPDACRPGCPACARVCPAGAIMFPQYSDPVIAGGPRTSQKHSPSPSPRSQDVSSAPPSSSTSPPAEQGQPSLDRLVDQLDQMEP